MARALAPPGVRQLEQALFKPLPYGGKFNKLRIMGPTVCLHRPAGHPTAARACTSGVISCSQLRPEPAAHAGAVPRSLLLKSSLMLAAAASVPAALVAQPLSAAAAAAAAGLTLDAEGLQNLSTVALRTLSDCQLAVSVYPTFSYNAAGGGGSGTVTQGADGRLNVVFDPTSLVIPSITYKTSKVWRKLLQKSKKKSSPVHWHSNRPDACLRSALHAKLPLTLCTLLVACRCWAFPSPHL